MEPPFLSSELLKTQFLLAPHDEEAVALIFSPACCSLLQQKLAQMLSRIMKIAEEFNVAVFLTNQGKRDVCGTNCCPSCNVPFSPSAHGQQPPPHWLSILHMCVLLLLQ